jgi:hypothetical protein
MRARNLARPWLILGAALLVGALLAGVAMAKSSGKPALKQFKLVRSQSAADQGNKCLKGAYANVRVTDAGQGNQNLYVTLNKAAKNTEFTVFLIQKANAPFGVSWYQGDIATNNKGHGTGHFVGIFNSEVFAISLGAVKPPQVDNDDAKNGVKFDPIHTFHLGVWFADPNDAQKANCSNTSTPFDGDHKAGIQALSSQNFKKGGPLGKIK